MKILHIIPSLKKGGAERLVLDTCRELSRRDNIEVLLVILRNENEYQYLCDEINLKITQAYVRPSILSEWQVDLSPLDAAIASFKPDIIHSHLFEAEVVSRYHLHKSVYVTHLHDNMSQMRNFSKATPFKKKLLTDFYEKEYVIKQYRKCHNNFVAISKDTSEYFTDVLPSDLHRITVMHNAIDYNRFYSIESKSVNGQVLRLVTVGSLVDKKNQIFLIEIAKTLLHRGVNFTVDILGDGPNRKMLSDAIEQQKFEKLLLLRGNVNNVESYLHQSHIYIHPAYYEPFGLVLLEAMAAGLPVITLDGKGNRDIMQNGKNGYIIAEQVADKFADVIQKLLVDVELYKAISAYAKQFASSYDIKNYCTKLLEYYSNLVDEK